MKRRNYRITPSTLRARAIYEAVTQFTQQHPLPRSRGRKPIYSEALILTLALLRTARRLSYRQLLFCVAPEVLPEEPLPALGTLLYRLQTIPDARGHALLHGLAAQGIAREVAGVSFDVPVVFVDGTGVGFDTPFCAQFRRGSEIPCEGGGVGVLSGWSSLGGAYADEGRLLSEWLGSYGSGLVGSGALLVGDKLYGYRGGLLSQVEAVGWLPVVRVGCGLRQGVRDKARVRALERLGGWSTRKRNSRTPSPCGAQRDIPDRGDGALRHGSDTFPLWGV